MIKILRSYGIPDKIVNAIEASYASTRAKVYSPDGVTEEFDIVKGVVQGDTLSPYLFVIILDYALRKTIKGHEEELGFTIVPRRSQRVHPIVLTDLDFAGDIALISDSVRQASELLQRVESECSKVGLLINYNKTKVMSVKQHNSLDGTYTRMLRKALHIKWQEHETNKEVYGKLPLVSSKIKARRMKMAGHYVRRKLYAILNSQFTL